MDKTKSSLGAGLVILSSFFYASYGIWTKLLGDSFGGYTASALRSVIVLIILLPIALSLRAIEPWKLGKNVWYILGMVVASFFIWGPLYYAVLHAGVGLALTVAYACITIGMMVFGWLWAGERITSSKTLAIVLGILGLTLIFSPGKADLAWLALGAAALSGVATAAATVLSKKIPYNAIQTTVMLWITSVIANLVMALVLREAWPVGGLDMKWAYLLFFAVSSVIATWSLTKGVKLIDAGIAGILGLLEIVFALVIGVMFFQEEPTLIAIIGAVVIILASAIPYIKRRQIVLA